MTRARRKAFVRRALNSRCVDPPSRATVWLQSRSTSDSLLMIRWNHNEIPLVNSYFGAYGVKAPGGEGNLSPLPFTEEGSG